MRTRVLPIAAATAVLASVLTGCTAASQAETCEPLFLPSALTDGVTVSGSTAADLSIQVPKSSGSMNAHRSVIASADGAAGEVDVVTAGSLLEANLAFVNAETGEILDVTPTFGSGRGQLLLASADQGPVVGGLLCAAVGDTVVTELSPQDSMAMGVDGQLVVVAEINAVYPSRAEGKMRALTTGFPAVTNDETGRPGMVLPPQQAPTKAKSALRIEGAGEKVAASDNVIGNVLTVSWEGQSVRNTWDELPSAFGAEGDEAQTGASFRSQLTGYPVGSQVVVIEPTGDGTARVSVVDILAVL